MTMMSRVWIRAAAATAAATTVPAVSPPSFLDMEPCVFGKSMFDSLWIRSVVASQDNDMSSSSGKHYDRHMISLCEQTSIHLNHDTNGIQPPNVSPHSISQNQNDNYRIVLEPLQDVTTAFPSPPPLSEGQQQHHRHVIPMGRARSCPSVGATACPTTIKQPGPDNSKKPHPALAVVGLVLWEDPTSQQRRILLTRRPRYMRSFPGAWVLPGGGLDPTTDASLADALQREVEEETGLILRHDSIQPISVWESVYPTDPYHPGPIQAHHLVVFLKANIVVNQEDIAKAMSASTPMTTASSFENLPTVTLQASEVESAVWLSVEDFWKVRQRMEEPLTDSSSLPTVQVMHSNGTTEQMSLDTLVGIYPQPQPPRKESHNSLGNYQHHEQQQEQQQHQQQQWCGIAQGSLFALEELLATIGPPRSTTPGTS